MRIVPYLCDQLKQESLASAKVSAWQMWYDATHYIGPQLGLPSNIKVIYISLKSTFSAQQFRRWQCGSIFIRLAVVVSQTCQLAQNSQKIWTYSSSRSMILVPIESAYTSSVNSNFGPILHSFWDTATYWLKIAYFSYPSLIRRPAPYVPFGISRWS